MAPKCIWMPWKNTDHAKFTAKASHRSPACCIMPKKFNLGLKIFLKLKKRRLKGEYCLFKAFYLSRQSGGKVYPHSFVISQDNCSLFWYNKRMKKEKIKNILWLTLVYYSVVLCLILVVVGFYLARTQREFLNVVLFLPISISLISLVVKNYKENKQR